MTCPICNEEPEFIGTDYCLAHHRALENLRHAFEKWTIAYGSLTLADFLHRVQKVPGIGQNAKETAHFLSENPSRWN
jgi:hypothetical protein